MNSVQLHLALTHVPVILSLVGLVMLLVSFFNKNVTLASTAYIVILAAGITAVPVYFSGEGAEEAVERLPGISENTIEEHEEIAKFAMICVSLAGLSALAALLTGRWPAMVKTLKLLVLFISFISGALMIQAASLGGKIRHTEINSTAIQNESTGQPGNDSEEHDKD